MKISEQDIEIDRIFSESLDLDYASTAFELLVDTPDFWVSATRWIQACNHQQPESSPYHLNESRVSKIVSLLTAQPHNPSCAALYEQFVTASHDFIVYSAKAALNMHRDNDKTLGSVQMEMPSERFYKDDEERSRFEFGEVPSPDTARSFIEEISGEISKKNTWSLTDDRIDTLKSLLAHQMFPVDIINTPYLFTNPDTGTPIVSYRTVENKEIALPILMSALLEPGLAEQITSSTLSGKDAEKFERHDLSPVEKLSIIMKDSTFLSHFDFDWNKTRERATQKMADIDNTVEPVTQVEQTVADDVAILNHRKNRNITASCPLDL